MSSSFGLSLGRLAETMRPQTASWTGGRVYNPGDGKSYKGSMTLVDAGHLKLQGCVIGVLCKSQVLKRIG